MRLSTHSLAVGAIIIAACIGGIAPVVAKIALQTFSPLQIVLARFGGATPILLFLAWRNGTHWRMPAAELRKICIGALLFAGNIIFFIFGIAQTTSVISQLLYLLTPFVVMFWTRILLRRQIVRAQLIGAGLGLSGALALIFASTQNVAFGTAPGNLLVGLAVLCWGSYLLYSSEVTKHVSPLQLLTTNSVVTAAIAIPFVLFAAQSGPLFLQPISTRAVLAIVFLILVSSVAMFFLFQWALQRVSAITVSSAQYLNPLVAAFFGALILQEAVPPQLLFGAALILTGSYYSLSATRQSAMPRWMSRVLALVWPTKPPLVPPIS